MEAICSSETSVDTQRTIWCYFPEDCTLHFCSFLRLSINTIYMKLGVDKCRPIENREHGWKLLSSVKLRSEFGTTSPSFGGKYCFHPQVRRVSRQQVYKQYLHTCGNTLLHIKCDFSLQLLFRTIIAPINVWVTRTMCLRCARKGH
jgi:hypothetical protein